MLQHDTDMLNALTTFGKTVDAAALIARRGVNTLILVHRADLMKQWQEKLKAFLVTDGHNKASNNSNHTNHTNPQNRHRRHAVHDSGRRGHPLTEGDGQILVDECHHVTAKTVGAIPKASHAKYAHGLTATPCLVK
jgi:superfamily II DNA or RNA helicase